MSAAIRINLDQSKILSSGNGLILTIKKTESILIVILYTENSENTED